jgi:hypothetical protein
MMLDKKRLWFRVFGSPLRGGERVLKEGGGMGLLGRERL